MAYDVSVLDSVGLKLCFIKSLGSFLLSRMPCLMSTLSHFYIAISEFLHALKVHQSLTQTICAEVDSVLHKVYQRASCPFLETIV